MGQIVPIPFTFPPEQKAPTRISVSGFNYAIIAPTFVRPLLGGTVKMILNWASNTGQFAKNIFYMGGPPAANTALTSTLQTLAEAVMTAFAGAALMPRVGTNWTLQSCTAKDNGTPSEAQTQSTHAALVGTDANTPYPPSCCTVWSWTISANYRGGKPRWYIPGATLGAVSTTGGSQLNSTWATGHRNSMNSVLAALGAVTAGGDGYNLGTISYQSGHAARPVPIFRAFTGTRVHERMDTQRRRLGKENLFPSVP